MLANTIVHFYFHQVSSEPCFHKLMAALIPGRNRGAIHLLSTKIVKNHINSQRYVLCFYELLACTPNLRVTIARARSKTLIVTSSLDSIPKTTSSHTETMMNDVLHPHSWTELRYSPNPLSYYQRAAGIDSAVGHQPAPSLPQQILQSATRMGGWVSAYTSITV